MTRDSYGHNDFHETPTSLGISSDDLARLAGHELWVTRASVLIQAVPESDAVVVLLLPVEPLLEVNDGPISYAFDGSGPDAVLVSLAVTGLSVEENGPVRERAARLLGDRVWAAARAARTGVTELVLSPQEVNELRPVWAQEAALQRARHELGDEWLTASVVQHWSYNGTMSGRELTGTRALVAHAEGESTFVSVKIRIQDASVVQAMTGMPLRRADAWPEIEVRQGPADSDPLEVSMVLPALRPDIQVLVSLTTGGETYLLTLIPQEVDGLVELKATLSPARAELEGEIRVKLFPRSR